MYGKIRKDYLFYYIGTLFYFFSQWVITVLVVRLSGYVDAGYLSLAMSTSNTFEIIALFRVRDFQISDYNSEYSNGEYVGSRIFSCAVAFILCVLFSAAGNEKNQLICIIMFMIIRTAEALSDVFQGVEQKYERYDYISTSFFLRGFGMIGLFYVMMYLGVSLYIVLMVIGIWSFFVVLVFEWRRCNRISAFKPVVNRKVFVLLKQCIPLMLCSFLISVMNLLPKMLLERYHGTERLGVYSSIASPTLIVQVLAGTVIYPVIPKLTKKLREDGWKGFSVMLHKLYLSIFIMTLVVFVGAALIGRIGLRILYGESILEDYDLFFPVVICTVVIAIVRIFTQILTVIRKIDLLTVIISITAVVCIAISFPLVRIYGGNGASFAQVISGVIAIFILSLMCEGICKKEIMN